MFPLDTIIDHDDGFDRKKSGYHLPALYFLSGLTKLTQIPLHLLKSSISVSLHRFTEERERDRDDESKFLSDVIMGAKCTGNFLQILFESQSRDLTTKVFAEETLLPVFYDPLSCYVTAWCIANSDPTSQWNLRFMEDNESRIGEFVNQFPKFGDSPYQHGTIIGLFANKPFDIGQSPSLCSHLQSLVFLLDFSDISDIDRSHLLSFLPWLHKLTSLKTLAIIHKYTDMEDNLRLSAASLLPQHCPSLSTIAVVNPVLFRSLACCTQF